jgi:hypothetical protein
MVKYIILYFAMSACHAANRREVREGEERGIHNLKASSRTGLANSCSLRLFVFASE